MISILIMVIIIIFIGFHLTGDTFWENNNLLMALSCVGSLMVAIASFSTSILTREQFLSNKKQRKQELKPIITPISSKVIVSSETEAKQFEHEQSFIKIKYPNENELSDIFEGIRIRLYNIGKYPAKNIRSRLKLDYIGFIKELNEYLDFPEDPLQLSLDKRDINNIGGEISIIDRLNKIYFKGRNKIEFKEKENNHFDAMIPTESIEYITISNSIIEPAIYAIFTKENKNFDVKHSVQLKLSYEDVEGTTYSENFKIKIKSNRIYDYTGKVQYELEFEVKNKN